jgi:hypothetical protein
MPITIDGTGTIAGISVGGLENGCVNEADLATAAVTNTKLASTAVTIDKLGTSEQSQLCKAWVNFDGTGTPAIRASFNVSSITDGGVGNYTVNLTNALADANYTCVSTSNQYVAVTDLAWGRATPLTSSTIAVYCFYKTGTDATSNTTFDPQIMQIAVFR